MLHLQSMQLSLDGTIVEGGASVEITGTGTLTYPHEEKLSLQLRVPATVPGDQDTIVPINERIEKGHVYLQFPSQSPVWKDVTSDQKGQVAPAMDPIANLDFAHAFRAADDLGDLVMDGVWVHHFSLNVDSARYVQQLQADPEGGVTPQQQALLTNAGIEVEVWIAARDNYMHQLKISMITPALRWDVTYRYTDFVKGGGTVTT